MRIRTPKPHSPIQRQIMEALVTPGLIEMWVAIGTKGGKTLGASGAMVAAAPLRSQALFRWIGPVYSQAKIGYNYLRRMLPSSTVELNKSDPSITFPSLDTRIQFLHGQKPEIIEGEATAGNVIDEAAKQKEAVYHAVKTTTTQTRGPTLCISTPLGKNYFYKGFMRAKEEMARAKRERRKPRMIAIHAPTWLNPHVPKESIEEMRAKLPKRLFQQYVEAAFVDDGSVFLFLVDAFGGPLADFPDDQVWFADRHESRAIYGGVDWAKQEDYTVFTALNDQGQLVGYKRFQRVPYPEQVGMMFQFFHEVKRRSVLVDPHVVVEHDQTGVGEAVHDMIAVSNPGFDVVGIRWNNALKEKYVTDLMMSFEEKALRLHPWQTLKDELEMFECSTTLAGRVVYSAPEGMHDDTVMSLVIANRLFREGRGSIANVATVDIVNNIVRKLHFQGGNFMDEID